MARIIIGILVGVLAAFTTVPAIEMIGHLLFPKVAPVGGGGPIVVAPAIGAFVASLPFGAKLMVMLAWLTGALVGAWSAARIARRTGTGWVPAALVLVAGIATVATIPHPLWMAAAAVLAPIAGGWVGMRLARGQAGRPPLS